MKKDIQFGKYFFTVLIYDLELHFSKRVYDYKRGVNFVYRIYVNLELLKPNRKSFKFVSGFFQPKLENDMNEILFKG